MTTCLKIWGSSVLSLGQKFWGPCLAPFSIFWGQLEKFEGHIFPSVKHSPKHFFYKSWICPNNPKSKPVKKPDVMLFSSPEPKAHWWTNSIPVTQASIVRPSSVNISNIFSSETTGPIELYFIWRLLRKGKRKFVQIVLVTWPRWTPRPYMVKTFKKNSSP